MYKYAFSNERALNKIGGFSMNTQRLFRSILIYLLLVLVSILAINSAYAESWSSINLINLTATPIYTLTNSSTTPGVYVSVNNILYPNSTLSPRTSRYAFEGEMISWIVLVSLSNGISDISEVYGALATNISGPYSKQVGCAVAAQLAENASLANFTSATGTFNSSIMRIYNCTYVVEPTTVIHGNYWFNVFARNSRGNISNATATGPWFMNPSTAININGTVSFGQISAGQTVNSTSMQVRNLGEGNISVNFTISGTDFFSATGGGLCPTSNRLSLSQFRYSATYNAYSITNAAIPYEISLISGRANVLNTALPYNASFSMYLTLTLPSPCNGQFTDGSIYLWASPV